MKLTSEPFRSGPPTPLSCGMCPGRRWLRRVQSLRLRGIKLRRFRVCPMPETPVQGLPARRPGGAPSFVFDPPTITAAKGNTFVVNLMISGAQNVYSVPVQMNYDPAKLQLVNVSNGGFLSQDGQAVALVHREDETTGTLQITATRPPGAGGVSGQGAVVTITFQAKASGQTPLTITRGGARDPSLQAITVNGAQAAVTVQ